MILGGSGWTTKACTQIAQFAENACLPIVSTFRRQDLVDNHHAHYAGDAGVGINPKLAARIKEADLILCVGSRLGETTTSGYTLLEVPYPAQCLIHIHADPNELGKVYVSNLPINSTPVAFADAVSAIGIQAQSSQERLDWVQSARADYLETLIPVAAKGDINLSEVVAQLRDLLPTDSIITNGAGNYTIWVQRFYQYRGLRTQLAPTSGSMGYGFPAAIAAKLLYPKRTVVCFAGDGCFLMTGQELATAVQYQANVILIVVNNGMYGSIRMHQERHYPGNVWATELNNPDFVALAKAYGAHGERVTKTADFAEAFNRAVDANRPALIELITSSDILTPRLTVQDLRAAKP